MVWRYKQSGDFQPGTTCHDPWFSISVAGVKEIWEQAILPANLPLTILLGLVVLFWLLTLIGAASADALNIDVDADVDAQPGHAGDVFTVFLRLVNAGFVPLTVVLSILILAMWMISLTFNFYFNPAGALMLSIGFFFVSLVFGLIITKAVTQPLVPLMRRLKAAEDAAPVIGEIGVVKSIQLDSEYGQVEVIRPDGAPALLNARLAPNSEPLMRGASVAILSFEEGKGVYLARAIPVTPLEL